MSDFVAVRNGTFERDINTLINKCEQHVLACEVSLNYFLSIVSNVLKRYILIWSCVPHEVLFAKYAQENKWSSRGNRKFGDVKNVERVCMTRAGRKIVPSVSAYEIENRLQAVVPPKSIHERRKNKLSFLQTPRLTNLLLTNLKAEPTVIFSIWWSYFFFCLFRKMHRLLHLY